MPSRAEQPVRADMPLALELRHVSKTFAGVRVLCDVDLTLEQGEIRALLGQNGSGKSTLIKILSGYHDPDEGASARAFGEEVPLPLRAADRSRFRTAFVHQDLGLVDRLSVMENMRVGRYERPIGYPISWRSERQKVRRALARFDLGFDPETPVGELSDIDRALLAIARAVDDLTGGEHPGILVLDEPTVYLPEDGNDRLFAAIRRVSSQGTAVLFVTHKLDEVLAVAHSVSVLRGGAMVGTRSIDGATSDQLTTMIVGRDIGEIYPSSGAAPRAEPLLEVDGLTSPDLESAALTVRKGEIVGLTGLAGSGFESVLPMIYGSVRSSTGTVKVGGRTIASSRNSPKRSLEHGVILVPANRLRDGIARTMTVEENVAIANLRRWFKRGFLREREMRRAVRESIEMFDVRPADPGREIATLSGGNQQKAVFAKWLLRAPQVLLLHEPTQGVDVGARKQIFSLIREVADRGAAVLIASTEQDDLAHLCDRVHVIKAGRFADELSGSQLTPARLSAEVLRPVSADAEV